MLPLAQLPPVLAGGVTVVRLILKVIAFADAANVNLFGSVGVAAITRDALAAAEVPDPVTDLVDWYYQGAYFMKNETEQLATTIVDVDLRTARKIRGEDRTLAFIFQSASGSGGAVTMSPIVRMLLMR